MNYSFQLFPSIDPRQGDDSANIMITLESGEKYFGSIYTFEQVAILHSKHKNSGEFLKGSYFWSNNLVLVEEINTESIQGVINHLIETDAFYNAFFPVNKEAFQTLTAHVN